MERKHIEKEKVLYIDIQGFTTPVFAPKELSLTYNGKDIKTYLFKSPVRFQDLPGKEQRTALWLEKYHHGLKYNVGNYDLQYIFNIVELHPASVVIVKGSQKLSFLRNFYSKVINIEDASNCVKFNKQWIFDCSNHFLTTA